MVEGTGYYEEHVERVLTVWEVKGRFSGGSSIQAKT
jgi:hypothetical protein